MTQQFPEPAVGALILNENDEIFLMTSPIWNGKYIIPGGHVELGETLEDALKREIKEETNLEIYDIEFLTFMEFIYGKEFLEPKHFIFFDYVCKTHDANVKLNEEGTKYIWISPDNATDFQIVPYTQTVIDRFICTTSQP